MKGSDPWWMEKNRGVLTAGHFPREQGKGSHNTSLGSIGRVLSRACSSLGERDTAKSPGRPDSYVQTPETREFPGEKSCHLSSDQRTESRGQGNETEGTNQAKDCACPSTSQEILTAPRRWAASQRGSSSTSAGLRRECN